MRSPSRAIAIAAAIEAPSSTHSTWRPSPVGPVHASATPLSTPSGPAPYRVSGPVGKGAASGGGTEPSSGGVAPPPEPQPAINKARERVGLRITEIVRPRAPV